MPARLPSRPGWYRDPDNPRLLRHWDGAAWGERSRRLPAWSHAVDLFVPDERVDRSSEGPVHPHELRETVASVGGWSRDWLPWRPRQAGPGWPRSAAQAPPRQPGPARGAPAQGLSPARRPLLAMMCLLVVAVAVVISSVAFITPYELRRSQPVAASLLAARFTRLADHQCAQFVPAERAAFSSAAVPRALYASAAGVDKLRLRLSRLHYGAAQLGQVEEWLNALRLLTRDQRHYASSLQAPTGGVGPLGPAPNVGDPNGAAVNPAILRSTALRDATTADAVSAGLALGSACRMGLGTSATT